MHPFLEKTERFVDKLIPYLIVALFFVVIVDVFFKETADKYHTLIYVVDLVVISFFVVDLAFKYNRVREIPRFLKLYWLDILAVFPFFIALRLFEELLLISEQSSLTLRNLFHAGVVVEEEVVRGSEFAKAARTSELIAKEGRLAFITKWFRPLRRLPRFFKAFSFYEHPEQRKTQYH